MYVACQTDVSEQCGVTENFGKFKYDDSTYFIYTP